MKDNSHHSREKDQQDRHLTEANSSIGSDDDIATAGRTEFVVYDWIDTSLYQEDDSP